MFQMHCSNCEAVIKSSHLVEVQLFLCPQCKEIVIVDNVIISKPKTSINLYTPLKELLLSAKEKFQLNKSNALKLKTKHEVDQRLAKLLRRDDFRLNISHDFFIQTTFGHHKRSAKLLNISSTGAAIEFFELGPLPEDESEINLQLLIPGQAEPLCLHARAVWNGKPEKTEVSPTITTGLQFLGIDEKTRTRLWDFIIVNETSDHT